MAEHGCKWRGLPEHFGTWHTVYTRMNRWSKNGVLDRVFEALQREQMIRVRVEALSLDSTGMKVHPDGTGARKKTARSASASPGADGTPNFIWLPRMPGQPSPSRALPATPMMPHRDGNSGSGWAYEDDETRQLAVDLGFTPVVPPKSNRTAPWKYDRELYKRRNEVERLFRRLKGFRRGFSRFEKLDVMFLGFIVFALIIDALISVNTP